MFKSLYFPGGLMISLILKIGRNIQMAIPPTTTPRNTISNGSMSEVKPEESGLASGIVNTSFMMGGALGLAVLASIAASRTAHLEPGGHPSGAALTSGYHVAFVVGALFAVGAAVIGAALLRSHTAPAYEQEPATA